MATPSERTTTPKRISNRLTHGFRSSTVLLPNDDPAEYEALLAELTAHFGPSDLTEDRQVREMADAEWRLRRVRDQMAMALARHIFMTREKLAAEGTGRALDLIDLESRAIETLGETGCSYATWLRYESKFERQYDRAYQSWTRYQEARRRTRRQEVDIAMKEVLVVPTPAQAAAHRQPPLSNVQSTATQQDPPVSLAPIARNAPCPCQSGEKYKRCCGRTALGVVAKCA